MKAKDNSQNRKLFEQAASLKEDFTKILHAKARNTQDAMSVVVKTNEKSLSKK